MCLIVIFSEIMFLQFCCFSDHTHKRITLLPDKLEDDSKSKLISLFSRGDKMQELNPKEANDILIRASPKDVC